MFGAGYRIYFGQDGRDARAAAGRRDEGHAGEGHPASPGNTGADYLEEK